MDFGLIYDSIDMWMMEIKRIEKEQHLLVAKSRWSAKDELRATTLSCLLDDILEKIRKMKVHIVNESSFTSVS